MQFVEKANRYFHKTAKARVYFEFQHIYNFQEKGILVEESIIFEKMYDHKIEDEFEVQDDIDDDIDTSPKLTFEEFLQRMQQDYIYILLPQRILAAKKFVAKAIEISELYEIDIKIVKRFSYISVRYCFEDCGNPKYLREVLRYADDISFWENKNGKGIVFIIDFYTHAVFNKNRRIMP